MIVDDRKFYTGSKRLILVENDSKYVLTTLHSNKIEIITRKINSPYPKTPETWSIHFSTIFGCPVIVV